jgi:hypothetical protein
MPSTTPDRSTSVTTQQHTATSSNERSSGEQAANRARPLRPSSWDLKLRSHAKRTGGGSSPDSSICPSEVRSSWWMSGFVGCCVVCVVCVLVEVRRVVGRRNLGCARSGVRALAAAPLLSSLPMCSRQRLAQTLPVPRARSGRDRCRCEGGTRDTKGQTREKNDRTTQHARFRGPRHFPGRRPAAAPCLCGSNPVAQSEGLLIPDRPPMALAAACSAPCPT